MYSDIEEILDTQISDLKFGVIDYTYLIENSSEFGLVEYNQAIASFYKVKKLSQTDSMEGIK